VTKAHRKRHARMPLAPQLWRVRVAFCPNAPQGIPEIPVVTLSVRESIERNRSVPKG